MSPTSTATVAEYGPFTIDDFDALPDDDQRHELINGRIVASPRPTLEHQEVTPELWLALRMVLPADYVALVDAEVSFTDPQQCLAPDGLVTKRRRSKGQLRAEASDVALAIEVLSPGSKRNDRHAKPRIYAAAGIPAYWLVESDPFTVSEYCLVGRWYQISQTVTGDEIVISQPFDLKVDLKGVRAATLA